jgi:hypothetical protein
VPNLELVVTTDNVAPGAIDHREFLNLDGADPRRACAEHFSQQFQSQAPSSLTQRASSARGSGRWPSSSPISGNALNL